MRRGTPEGSGVKKRALVSVNLAVLLFGLAGLFAKWIRLPAVGITFGRVVFSSLALLAFSLGSGQSLRLRGRGDLARLLLGGGILALHWWAFLASVQLSTVAIGTLTFSAFPLFVTFLEPLVFREPLRPGSVGIALVILLGVAVTVPAFSLQNRQTLGILTGLLSALSYAALTLLNKSLTRRYSGTVIAFWEQAAAAVLLLPFAAGLRLRPSLSDLGLLLLLGVLTTALAHTLFINSLRSIPARVAGVCSSMETVYGILFALLLLHEVPSVREILGAALIVGAVAVQNRREAEEKEDRA